MRSTTIGRWVPAVVLGFLLPLLLAPVSSADSPAGLAADTQLVSVRVESEEGRYLEDTVVVFYRLNGGTWTQERVVETDRDGAVQLHVPVGTYRVRFTPASPDHQTVFYGGATTFDDAQQIVIGPDDHPHLNVRLPAVTWVAGRLLDGSGAPAVSNGVALEKLYGDGHWGSFYDVLTGPGGTYRLGIYDPGFYRVSPAYPGTRAPTAHSAVFEVTARGQTFTGKDVRLPLGGSIAGVVRRADGTPFRSADVELIGIVDGRVVTEFSGSNTFTDAQGRYRFEGLAAGDYRVIASDSSNDFTSVVWPDDARFADGRDITVTPGGTTRLTDIELRRVPLGRARAQDPPTIAGDPVVGSVLRADPGDWGLPVNGEHLDFSYQWFADGRAIAGANGRSYRPTKGNVGEPLVVMVTGSGPWAQPGIAFSEPTDPVRLLRASGLRAATALLPPSASGFGQGRISGQLLAADGSPVVGALVEAIRAEGRYHAFETISTRPTDVQGRYELVGLPPGAYQVTFHPTGTQPAFPVTSAPEGGTVLIDADNSSRVVDAQLAPAALIQGRVTLPSGGPAPYAEVQYMRTDIPGGFIWREHRADADGRYTVLVQPGTYRVKFSRPYYDFATVHWPSATSEAEAEDIVVGAGQSAPDIDGRLFRGGRIQGTVRLERTLDPFHVEIAIYQHTDEGWNETRIETFKYLTDRFGRFDLAGLPPGTYRIRFEPFGGNYFPEFWNDASDLEGAQDIVVPEGAVVTGKNALIADGYADYPIRVFSATRPRIKGAAEVGRKLTVTTGTWSPSSVRLTYQWLVGGRPVAGATGRSLRVPRRALGQRITVKVHATAKYWQPETVKARPTKPVVR